MTLDALLKVKPRTSLCVVGQHLEAIPEKYRTALAGLLSNPEFSGRSIAKAMNEAGLDTSATSVVIHRRGDCGCKR